jgi:hypothetical protein
VTRRLAVVVIVIVRRAAVIGRTGRTGRTCSLLRLGGGSRFVLVVMLVNLPDALGTGDDKPIDNGSRRMEYADDPVRIVCMLSAANG